MPIPTAEERLGTLLGKKYRLDAILGRGGVGIVYAGMHTWTDRPVAVKLLDPRIAEDAAAVDRFLLEARTATKLRHPNVVDVLDMGADDAHTVYLVMERLEGQSFAEMIAAEAPLPAKRILSIAGPVLSALQYTHDRGVIHRDLKPDNIFVSRDVTGDEVPKLLDFGIAKAVEESTQRLTADGMVVGTPHYMSPEQARNATDLGPKTDIWSMGVILYEALTGERPFDGATTVAVLGAIDRCEYVDPAERVEVPKSFARALRRTLRREPGERYDRIEELAFELGTADDDDEAGDTAVDPPDFGPDDDAETELYERQMHGAQPTGEPAPTARSGGLLRSAVLGAVAMAGLLIIAAVTYFATAGPTTTEEPSDAADAAGETAAVAPAAGRGPPIRLAVSGTIPHERLTDEYAPLVRHLSDRLGRPVELVTVATYPELSQRIVRSEVDIAWLPAYEFVRVRRQAPDIALLATPVEEEGDADYQGVIVTPDASGLDSLDALEGKRFCYVSPTSSSGYLYPRAVLRQNGLDPDTLFSQTLFVDAHANVLPALEDDRCDAAATYAAMLFGADNPTAYQILATTESIPYGPYVAAATLELEIVDAVRRELLSIAPGSAAADRIFEGSAKITGFEPVDVGAYEPLRDIEGE